MEGLLSEGSFSVQTIMDKYEGLGKNPSGLSFVSCHKGKTEYLSMFLAQRQLDESFFEFIF